MQALEENLINIQRDLDDLLDCYYDVDFLIKKMEADYNIWLDAVDVRREIEEKELYDIQMSINAQILATNQTLIHFIHLNNIHTQAMNNLIYSLRK